MISNNRNKTRGMHNAASAGEKISDNRTGWMQTNRQRRNDEERTENDQQRHRLLVLPRKRHGLQVHRSLALAFTITIPIAHRPRTHHTSNLPLQPVAIHIDEALPGW